jgi:poly(A) polymerase
MPPVMDAAGRETARLLADLRRLPLLRRIGAAASGQPLYATGGFLRDRLTGAVPKAELDLTLPDPRRLLRRFTLRNGESSFLMDAERDTYRLVFSRPGPFSSIDLTRLRAGSIEEDLLLRDFTVNALAMEIGGRGRRGRIIDPAGGRADLRKSLLRPCSPRSFRDDPLRLLRGVRFEANLGFRLADETLRLMKGSRGGLRSVAAERVRDEFFQVLQGPAPLKGLKRIAALRLLGHLGCPFDAVSLPPPRRLRRLHALLEEFHPRSTVSRELGRAVDQVATRRGMLLLAGWLLDTSAAERSGLLLRRLALGKKAVASLRGGLESKIPLSHLRNPGTAGRAAMLDLFHRADEAVEEAVLLRASALSPAKMRKDAAAGFLEIYLRTRKIFLRPPLLSGADALASLPVSPGPALGKLLEVTRRAQDLGRFRTLPGALRWARGELARSD